MSRRCTSDAGPRRSAEHGFTLVEMMVALAIFALIAGAGVGLLAFAVRAQAAAKARLDADAVLGRVDALLAADLAQAVARPTRGEDGAVQAAFVGEGGAGIALGLVRGGWSNPQAHARPSLQKVAWRLDGDVLMRTAWPMLDGAAPGASVAIAHGVDRFELRYRRADGEWRARWDAQDAAAMPLLVEATLAFQGGAPIVATYLMAAAAP